MGQVRASSGVQKSKCTGYLKVIAVMCQKVPDSLKRCQQVRELL
jgi:hypothetical protein